MNIKKRLIRFLTFRILLPNAYKSAVKKTNIIKNKCLFVEVSAERLTDNFALLYKACEKKGYALDTAFLKNGKVSSKEYLKNSLELMRKMADAEFIFVNDASNVLNCVNLRNGQRLIQTWHACGAFKKFGFSTREEGWGLSEKELNKYPYYKNQSLVTVSSPEVIPHYADAMRNDVNVIKPLGVSRTDVFFDNNYIEEAKKEVRALVSAEGVDFGNKKLILYAPTFRGTSGKAFSQNFDICMLKSVLSSDCVLIINEHPFVKKERGLNVPEDCSGFAVNLTGKTDVSKLLCAADALVTDYSSIVFEYSLFEKPVCFFAPDLSDYYDDRGFYYDYASMTPGPVFDKEADVAEYVRNAFLSFDRSKIHEFKEKFMSACDGKATERILLELGL